LPHLLLLMKLMKKRRQGRSFRAWPFDRTRVSTASEPTFRKLGVTSRGELARTFHDVAKTAG
jgi:hypothetical protein